MSDNEEEPFMEVHEIVTQKLGHIPISKGDFHYLPKKVQKWVIHAVSILFFISKNVR